jgi:NADP-dependent 3-hydroxy acid dehydrogenase YdfG
MSKIDLNGKGVLVSGATGGIGQAVARELAERGAKVALMARPTERLEAAVDELQEFGAIAAPADVTDRAQVVKATDEAAEAFGGLIAVIAGAGVVKPALIGDQPEEDARNVIDVNLYGTLWAIQAALPHVDRSGGHLLALASISGITPVPLTGLYSASKAAVGELMAQLRMELMHREATAGTVYLGMVETEMSDQVKEDPRIERALDSTPGGVTKPLPVDNAARRVVRAVEHRERAVVTPAWQMPFAAPQLGMQAVVELGMRATALARELPGRRTRAPFDESAKED